MLNLKMTFNQKLFLIVLIFLGIFYIISSYISNSLNIIYWNEKSAIFMFFNIFLLISIGLGEYEIKTKLIE